MRLSHQCHLYYSIDSRTESKSLEKYFSLKCSFGGHAITRALLAASLKLLSSSSSSSSSSSLLLHRDYRINIIVIIDRNNFCLFEETVICTAREVTINGILLLIIGALVFKNAQFRYISNISRYHVECEIHREILHSQRTYIYNLISRLFAFYLILYVRTIETFFFRVNSAS